MKQDIVVLVDPTEEYAQDARKYRDDCLELDGEIHGGGGLDAFEDYTGWLQFLEVKRKAVDLPEGLVSSETYFAIHEEDDRIIGMADIRKTLNEELLRKGGNISVSVRPCYRGEGYGKRIMELALKRCKELGMKKVLLVCKEESIRSANLILSCGGIEEPDEEGSYTVRRFWITIE